MSLSIADFSINKVRMVAEHLIAIIIILNCSICMIASIWGLVDARLWVLLGVSLFIFLIFVISITIVVVNAFNLATLAQAVQRCFWSCLGCP